MKKTSTFLFLFACAFSISNAQVQRLPLHEVFTSSTCGPCAAASPNLLSVFNASPDKWTCVKYQMNWPGQGDPYYSPTDGNSRRGYYGVNSIPNMFVDGTNNPNEGSYTTNDLDGFYNVPAQMTIQATFSVTGNSITVNATVTPLADFPQSNIKLQMAVVEKVTTGNVMTNGETQFENVMMKMLPGAGGTVIGPLTNGTAVTKSQTYDMSSTHVEEMSDLAVVVFVQDYASKAVYQSAWAWTGVGINATEKTGVIALFPNPASQQAFLQYETKNTDNVKIEVVNNIGQVVYTKEEGILTAGHHQLDIDTHSFATGIYNVRLTAGNDVVNRKLSIVQ